MQIWSRLKRGYGSYEWSLQILNLGCAKMQINNFYFCSNDVNVDKILEGLHKFREI